MKLLSFSQDGRVSFGAVMGDEVADLGAVMGDRYPTLEALMAATNIVAEAEAAVKDAPRLPLAGIGYLPPILAPDKIICVGLNYEDHRLETKREPTEHPTLFSRFANAQRGHDEALLKPAQSDKFDYEAELAVIIGKAGRGISKDDAMTHIAGYACFNDGSVRDWQAHSTQFLPGKNFVGSGGFGPFLVTADEISDPFSLDISCRLNGETMQASNTAQMIFPIDALIAYISTFTELVPGDVIVTGTPGGVGVARKPPVYMKAGDVVEVDIAGVGLLRNRIANAKA